MILPTILYGLEDPIRTVLLQKLGEIAKKTETPFQIRISTDNVNEMIMQIDDQNCMALIVLGIDSISRDKQRLALRLGKYAMRVNRDHYVVYIVKERTELEQLLPFCTRSAGILTCPPEEKSIMQTFTPLFEDYRRMYARETSQDGRWLNLKADGRIYRVCMNDVCSIQAVNKMVEFRTMKRTIQIYSNMSNVEKMLDDTFLRCHRSYFINRNQIQFIEFKTMCIHMMDGSVIPLARSFKECIQSAFAVQED